MPRLTICDAVEAEIVTRSGSSEDRVCHRLQDFYFYSGYRR